MIVTSQEAKRRGFLGVNFIVLAHGAETMVTKMLYKQSDHVPFHQHPWKQRNWSLEMTSIRNRAIEGIRAGDEFSVSRTFTEQDMLQFAGVSRDYNPVHLEDRFAKAKEFRGRICHGLLVGSMLTEIGGQIGVLASRMDFVFKKPVYFGDTVLCRWVFTEVNRQGRAKAQVQFRNQDDIVVLAATVEGIIPGIPERAVLKAMVEEGDPTNNLSRKS